MESTTTAMAALIANTNCRTCTQACGPDETTLELCTDGIDNGGDGFAGAKTAIALNSSVRLKAAIPATKTPKKPAQTVSIMTATPTSTAMTWTVAMSRFALRTQQPLQ